MATITGSGVLIGTAGNDTITGDTTNDVLVGHSGSDILNGGDGDDILAPDTSYFLISDGYPFFAERYFGSNDDGVVDHVDGGGGFDRVALRFDGVTSGITADFSNPSVVQTLAGSTIVNVEQFELVLGSGSDAVILGIGNDMVLAGAGDDMIDGRAGNDAISGEDGSDVLSGGDGNDSLYGDEGDDTLDGGNQDDVLYGQAGDDRFIGGSGNDMLNGGEGNDTAVLEGNLADYVYEISELAGGFPFRNGWVRVTNTVTGEVDQIDAIEQLEFADVTAAAADVIKITRDGTEADDLIYGSYVGDTINAGGGDDVVLAFKGNDVVNGEAGDDVIRGEEGNDTLNGGSGNDYLDGGDGNDIIRGGSGIDRINLTFETATAGVNYTFGNGVIVTSNGTKTLTSIERVDITGSQYADTFTGGSASDFLDGGGGDDTLNGLDGEDTLFGYIGNDRLNGGSGSDWLVGGPGADTFAFTLVSDSASGAPDVITDFTSKGKPAHAPGGERDTIDLSAIDANVELAGDQSFKLGQKFTGDAGQAYSSYDEGTDMTSLFLDVDGDEVADMTIQLLGQINLTRADYIL